MSECRCGHEEDQHKEKKCEVPSCRCNCFRKWLGLGVELGIVLHNDHWIKRAMGIEVPEIVVIQGHIEGRDERRIVLDTQGDRR